MKKKRTRKQPTLKELKAAVAAAEKRARRKGGGPAPFNPPGHFGSRPDRENRITG